MEGGLWDWWVGMMGEDKRSGGMMGMELQSGD